jgi:glycerol uptake facilitator-like aquaporin
LWGVKTTVAEMAGCVIPDDMDLSQAFAIEFASSFLIFIVGFGCAIDPVASRVYGPIYAPLLIGVAVGLIIFGTSALVPGYTGAGVNPARCFGPVLVSNDGWKEFWAVFAAAPVVASIVHAPVYRTAPPDHAQ